MRWITMAIIGLVAGMTAYAADYKVLADRKVDFDAYKTFSFDKQSSHKNNSRFKSQVAPDLSQCPAENGSESSATGYFDGAWRAKPNSTKGFQPIRCF